MRRFAPFAVLFISAALGMGMTYAVYRAEESARHARFEVAAEDIAARIQGRVDQHLALLASAHSFMVARGGEVTRAEFETFVGNLAIRERFAGIQGLGFAALIAPGQEEAAEGAVLRDYGIARTVWPKSDQDWRTAIVLLEPADERNRRALLFDMFHEQTRRSAMLQSVQLGVARATVPVQLVQEISGPRQTGFLAFIPLFRKEAQRTGRRAEDVSGFVYAPFRAGDLHNAALGQLRRNLLVRTVDVSGDEVELYRSDGFDSGAPVPDAVTRHIEIAGRTWAVTVAERASGPFSFDYAGAMILGVLSLILAGALATSVRSQSLAVEAAQRLHATSLRAAQDKEMMLQEMKHRIKNSIARIMAIARQTAAKSTSLDEFTQTFSSRLQSMASAQDMLTRSHAERAELRELLEQELNQIFGASADARALDGPPTVLNERATQAFSLTFHELATNAMKYGNGAISVEWNVDQDSDGGTFKLKWTEKADVPPDFSNRGFGTRLIDANIAGELGGKVERHYADGVLYTEITCPAGRLD